jgi:secreted trypsin-like serine protease
MREIPVRVRFFPFKLFPSYNLYDLHFPASDVSASTSPVHTDFNPTVALAGFSPSAAAVFAQAGGDFDGVARISTGSVYGSGTLLSTGRHILTAAHVVDDAILDQLRVHFTLPSGIVSLQVTKVTLHPGWSQSADEIDHDVAVLELSSSAPTSAQRYDVYTGSDEIGQTFTMVGYGAATATGTDTSSPTRRAGENIFEADATRFNQSLGWDVTANRQLVFDYDDGLAAHDAFGRYFGVTGLGLGAKEAMMTPGDSGGPTFLQKDGKWLVAGVNSYTARPSNSLSDVDSTANGSFGEFGALMRASAYRPWIDSITGVERVIVGQAGTRPDRTTVSKKVTEGGVTWFLVEIGEAQTSEVSVHYVTRDGTAKASEDYLAAQGEIVFAAGQTWCQVLIETLADTRAEGDESFSLVLTSPKGGQFDSGQTELAAVRTISDGVLTASLVGVNGTLQDGLLA